MIQARADAVTFSTGSSPLLTAGRKCLESTPLAVGRVRYLSG